MRQIAGQDPSAFFLFVFIEVVIIVTFVAIALLFRDEWWK